MSSATEPALLGSIKPEIADLLGELAIKHKAFADVSRQEAEERLRLLMVDVSYHLDPEALAVALRIGSAKWKAMPTCAHICEAAKDFIAERAVRWRNEREAAEREARAKLPPPAYVAPEDTDKVLAEVRATLLEAERRDRGFVGLGTERHDPVPLREVMHPSPPPPGYRASPQLVAFAARIGAIPEPDPDADRAAEAQNMEPDHG